MNKINKIQAKAAAADNVINEWNDLKVTFSKLGTMSVWINRKYYLYKPWMHGFCLRSRRSPRNLPRMIGLLDENHTYVCDRMVEVDNAWVEGLTTITFDPATASIFNKILLERVNDGDKAKEARRRATMRDEYLKEARSNSITHTSHLNYSIWKEKEEFMAQANLVWEARQRVLELEAEAQMRWPENLTLPCPGDMGVLGEIFLALDDEEEEE